MATTSSTAHEVVNERPAHTLAPREVEALLGTSENGLIEAEATRRLEQYGPNEVEQERATPWWKLALHQFRDPLIYVLLVAGIVTVALAEYTDAAVICAVLLINAAIGFVQELRAQRAMRALAELSAPQAEILREGSSRIIASRELVPGDVVLLASGARVPADLRLFRAQDFEIDESALTGESVPSRKNIETLDDERLVAGDQRNMAFAGTVVTRGRGRGVVVRTGARTELGRIATSMRELVHTTTPLQAKVARLGRWIGVAILILCALVVAIGLIRGMPLAEVFVAAVAMAVATIPEGLPIVLTVTLAIGVRRMARRRAIIRSLPAVETLGSTTAIGSDKTGTLTRNEMTVKRLWAGGRGYETTGGGYSLDGELVADGRPVAIRKGDALYWTLLAGTLANEADPSGLGSASLAGDPTELALHVAAAKAGLHPSAIREDYAELDLLPFESERRFMATLHDGSAGRFVFVKGAPEAVLSRCVAQSGAEGSEPLDADGIREAARTLAAQGLRVLAMAYRPTDSPSIAGPELASDLVFAGLQAMEDPVRPEAVEAVAAARAAGIRVFMLTGDHADTATAIGRQLGLGEGSPPAIEGYVLDTLSDEALDAHIRQTDIYARVAPEHKLRIVQRLRAQGEIVAVTGDGVNDAPALRAAHLGIAMGKGGTDVAREASDMVLADDNFATITAAVEEGRVVFANIRKVTFFLLSTGVSMPMTILIALLAGWPLPFLAVQVLWINLVTNGLQDVALAFEPGEPGQLRRPPRAPSEGILSQRLLKRLFAVGVVLTVGTLSVFWWTLETTGDLALAQSVAMTQMVVFQFFHVFNSRSLDRSVTRVPLFSNRFLFVSVVAAIFVHVAALHVSWLQMLLRTTPLSASEWLLVLAVGTSVIIGGELDKWRNRRRGIRLG
jgi:magnesium-transporting ATPase (P-type)